MLRNVLKSKLHRVVVTDANLEYEGSITIDSALMKAADIVPYEQVKVWNITNGERFETYAIPGRRGSGVICVNGAAARKVARGDLLIVASFCWLEEAKARKWKPRIVKVTGRNKPLSEEEVVAA